MIEQLPGEPLEWYERFTLDYLPMMLPRSVLGAYKSHQVRMGEIDEKDKGSITNAPNQWYDNYNTWSWKERAEDQDKQELEDWYENLDELKRSIKQERVEGLLTLLRKSEQGLRLKEGEELRGESVASLSQAKKTAVRELREELDGHSTTSQLDIIIKSLPPELQKLLERLVT